LQLIKDAKCVQFGFLFLLTPRKTEKEREREEEEDFKSFSQKRHAIRFNKSSRNHLLARPGNIEDTIQLEQSTHWKKYEKGN